MHKIVVFALLCSGCATIFTGTTDEIEFDSNVTGTRLSIDGQLRGTLPLRIEISRNFIGGRQFLAKFEREGYEVQQFALEREFNTVAILDIFSTLTSGGIDLLSGALMRFSPRAYHVQMLPIGQSASSAEFQRGLEAYRFGLFNWEHLRIDVAGGGGEYLSAFASVLTSGDRFAAGQVVAASMRHASRLITARSAPAFVALCDEMLASDDHLERYRLGQGR